MKQNPKIKPKPAPDLAQQYLAHLAHERRLSAHTQKSYARDLQRLAEFLAQTKTDWRDVDAARNFRKPV